MKRTFALLLALTMCLSLAACGSSVEKTESTAAPVEVTLPAATAPAETASIVTEPSVIQLVKGEYATISDAFQVKVTDVTFEGRATSPTSSHGFLPKEGYVYVAVYFDVKYTGKAEISYNGIYATLKYGDGYTFTSDHQWFYATPFDSWLNSGSLDPLTPEFGCITFISVPKEVQENTANPLSISIFGGAAEYIVRP